MRKATSVTVVYNKYFLYSVTINYKGDLIPFDYSNNPKQYKSFTCLYYGVLQLLKNNDFYVKKWFNFDSWFYDIQFIWIKKPYKIDHFGLKVYDEGVIS